MRPKSAVAGELPLIGQRGPMGAKRSLANRNVPHRHMVRLRNFTESGRGTIKLLDFC